MPVTKLQTRLPRAWENWLERGLDPVVGFATVAEAIAALPSNEGESDEPGSPGRVRVLSAWPLTRHKGWTLLCTRALLALPAIAATSLSLVQPRPVGAAPPAGAWMLCAFGGLIIAGLWLPLNTGLMAYIYRRSAAARLESANPP